MLARRNTLVEQYEYISAQDPAVDSSGKQFGEQWRLYLDGKGDPPLKQGQKPTRIILRHLSTVEQERVRDLAAEKGSRAGAVAAAALALVALKDEDSTHRFPRQEDRDWIHRLSVVTQEGLDILSPEVIEEIGLRVWAVDLMPRPL